MLSTHVPRISPFSSSVFHTASALSAPSGHLPLEGKALSVVILFPHMRVFALTMREKRHSRIAALPIGEGGPRSDALVYDALETIFSLSFIPLVPYPARFARHLPHAGKALSVVILFSTYACIRSDNARKAAFSYRRSLLPWGRGTAQRWIGCSRKRRTCDDLSRSFSYRFPHPTSAPSGHLLP